MDLKERGRVTPDWPLRENLLINSPLPEFLGLCSLGSSFYFAGGMGAITDEGIIEEFDDTTKLWCLKYDDSTYTWTWSICGYLFGRRIRPLVVPYQGKLYIFGGESNAAYWVDIYTIRSHHWERREVPSSAIKPDYMDPRSYFLWEDTTKPQKRTLIVLYFCCDNRQWLLSYDVNANSWGDVDYNFPLVPEYHSRQLLRLGCNHLVILDFAKVWYIYDLAKKELLAKVVVNDLDDSEIMSDIFCCHHTNEESLIYVFMEPDEKVVDPEESPHPQSVCYARVKLQHPTFAAKVESKSSLKVGPYIHRYM
ncbi:hypothetical protein PIB30_100470 [Stylosanthes scabra]|uniref:F-box/kelch-repeat protein n=1 Tax=Stylosanthes scabra TaxID=79078 RepID=A0ABU6SXF3_9FABA|nr:hypothetical protein [Stylosanthes scabra]